MERVYDEDDVRSVEVKGEAPLVVAEGTLAQWKERGLKDWQLTVACGEPCYLEPGGPYELLVETDEGDTFKGPALLKSAASFERLLFKGAGELIQQN